MKLLIGSAAIFATLAFCVINFPTGNADEVDDLHKFREYDGEKRMVAGSNLNDLRYMTLHQNVKKGVTLNDLRQMQYPFGPTGDKRTRNMHADWAWQVLHNPMKKSDKTESKKNAGYENWYRMTYGHPQK